MLKAPQGIESFDFRLFATALGSSGVSLCLCQEVGIVLYAPDRETWVNMSPVGFLETKEGPCEDIAVLCVVIGIVLCLGVEPDGCDGVDRIIYIYKAA